MKLMPHQIATKAIGGKVYVSSLRDPADGTARYGVVYTFGDATTTWVSRHRFPELAQAEAGCLALSDFLGAEFCG
jgi:hypothetical protein